MALASYCRDVMRDGRVDSHEARQLMLWRHRLLLNDWEKQLRSSGIDPAEVARLSGLHDATCPIELEWRPPRRVMQGDSVALHLRAMTRLPKLSVRVTLRKDGAEQVIPEWRPPCQPGAPAEDVRQVIADVPGDIIVRIRVDLIGQIPTSQPRAYDGWVVFAAIPRSSSGNSSIHVEGSAVAVIRQSGAEDRGEADMRNADWTRCELREAHDDAPKIEVVHRATSPVHHRVLIVQSTAADARMRLLLGDSIRIGRQFRAGPGEDWLGNEIALTDGVPDQGRLADNKTGDLREPFCFLSARALRLSAVSLASGLRVEVPNKSGASLDAGMLPTDSSLPVSRIKNPFEIALGGDYRHAIVRFTPLPRAAMNTEMNTVRLELGPESILAQESRRAGIAGFLVDVEIAGFMNRHLWLLDAMSADCLGVQQPRAQGVLLSQLSNCWLMFAPDDTSNHYRAWSLEPNAHIEVTPRICLRIAAPPST